MIAHYFNPTARKFMLLGLFAGIVLIAWPLPAARYCWLCFFLSCYTLLSRN